MEKSDKKIMLDIGGGPEWDPSHSHSEWLVQLMDRLRAVQLARQDPKGIYVVLDIRIPKKEAAALIKEIPNLHFVEYKIAQNGHLPFADESIQCVEINHMWTPLTTTPAKEAENDLKGIPGALAYLSILEEASRVLIPGGALSITEKDDRLKKVRKMLSNDGYLDLDGLFMDKLGLDTDPKTQSIQEVLDKERSNYTNHALTEGVRVFTLKLKKSSHNVHQGEQVY